MPRFAVFLPRHVVFDTTLRLLLQACERRDRRLEKLQKRCGFDLRHLVNDDHNLLHSRRRGDFDAVAVSRKTFEARRVAERFQVQFRAQNVFLERAPTDAEHELQVRLVARHCVEEPAVRFLRGRDFDDAAVVPVRIGERAEFVDALVHPREHGTLPFARFPRRGDAVFRVPTFAVFLPWQLRIFPHFGDVHVADECALRSLRVVAFACHVRSRCKNLLQNNARMRDGPRLVRRLFRHDFGCALRDDLPAANPRFGADVDDPICRLDDFEIVLDDDDGVAEVGEAVEHVE